MALFRGKLNKFLGDTGQDKDMRNSESEVLFYTEKEKVLSSKLAGENWKVPRIIFSLFQVERRGFLIF